MNIGPVRNVCGTQATRHASASPVAKISKRYFVVIVLKPVLCCHRSQTGTVLSLFSNQYSVVIVLGDN